MINSDACCVSAPRSWGALSNWVSAEAVSASGRLWHHCNFWAGLRFSPYARGWRLAALWLAALVSFPTGTLSVPFLCSLLLLQVRVSERLSFSLGLS